MRRAPLAALRTAAAIALGAAVLILGAAGCEPSTTGISTDAVGRSTVVEVVDVPASVTAKAVATLSAPADGTVTQLTVHPGQSVTAGAVLAVVDSPAAQQRLAQARAALAAAKNSGGRGGSAIDLSASQKRVDQAAAEAFAAARAAAEQIHDETLRAALLADISAAEQSYHSAAQSAQRLIGQVQRGLASVGSALSALGAAQRIQAQSAFDLAKATVDALTLKAPIAGVVQLGGRATAATTSDPLSQLLGAVGGAGSLPSGAGAAASGSGSVPGVDDVLVVGDRVSAGTAIVTIVDVSELGLAGEVDETDVLLVGDNVTASVELDAAPGVRYEATVRSVDLLPTPSARGGVAYRIRLSLEPGGDGGAPTPRPGMSAVAHLRVRTATDAVSVPASAVFTSELGDTVWLVRDGTAVRQQVRLGVQGTDLVEVLSGVTPGQTVVVSGTDKVRPGLKLP